MHGHCSNLHVPSSKCDQHLLDLIRVNVLDITGKRFQEKQSRQLRSDFKRKI